MGISKSLALVTSALLITSGGFSSNLFGQEPAPAFSLDKKTIGDQLPKTAALPLSEGPSVVFRPGINKTELLEDCIVQLVPNYSNQEATLKIYVPDSVKVIEVVPNTTTDTKREFRLRMDANMEQSKHAMLSPLATMKMAEAKNKFNFRKNPFFQPLQESDYTDEKVVLTSTTNILDSEQRVTNAAFETEFSTAQSQVKFSGPNQIGLGGVGEFAIEIQDPQSFAGSKVDIELSTPDGLELVVVNRQYEFDQAKQTLNFKLEEAQSAQQFVIYYRVKGNESGRFRQKVTVRVDGKVRNELEHIMNVQLGLATSDAPALPFED